MKFNFITFPILLASIATAASISNEFEEQVEQTKTLQLRGTASERVQQWLVSNQSYINDSLEWSHALKQKAGAYAAEGAASGTCTFPDIVLDNTVNGNLVSLGSGTHMTSLPATDDIFQGWEDNSKINLQNFSNMKTVGCSDALNKAGNGKMGCYVSVCLYSL
jgi:hypothetical protein